MKKAFAFICCLTFGFIAITSAQRVDTIYYDKDWKGVSNKLYADFYRLAIYPTNPNYKKLIRDYYISGELQGTSGFISIDKFDDSKSILDGECISYFKNGKIETKSNYKNGKLNGEYYEYLEDGLIKSKGEFVNGELSGLYTEFLEDGNFMQAEYVSGKSKYDYYILGNQNGLLVKIKFSDNEPIWETPSTSERKTEYIDGTPWQYYIKNGVTVAETNTTTRDYGKWHRVDIIISNNSIVPIEFDPEKDITAFSTDKKYRNEELEVWSCDRYMKKVRNAQIWAAVAMGMAAGMSAANAGYSTSTTRYSGSSSSYGNASAYGSGGYAYGSYYGNSSYSGTSTTTTYNAYAAYQAQILAQNQMANMCILREYLALMYILLSISTARSMFIVGSSGSDTSFFLTTKAHKHLNYS